MKVLNEETILNPNFSIVTPGPCNAKCSFCFWKKEDIGNMYLTKLIDILDNMPSQFEQISITGGEPTLSPYLTSILKHLGTSEIKEQFKKIVLTTNGAKIIDFADKMKGVVDHINISRHSISDELNAHIFRTNTIPNTKQLTNICEILNNNGIDVTISAVLTPECFNSREDILKYIKYAKSVGASAVSFRIKHGVLDEHYLEQLFSNIHYDEHNCGVCRHRKQLIQGMKVTWKASVLEPSNDLDGVMYEGIYNQNGKFTKDWEAKHEVMFDDYFEETQKEGFFTSVHQSSGSSCGSVSSGGCGSSSSRPRQTFGCGSTSGC